MLGFTFKLGRVHYAWANNWEELEAKLKPSDMADVVVVKGPLQDGLAMFEHYKAVQVTETKLLKQSDGPVQE